MSAISNALKKLAEQKNQIWHFSIENPDEVNNQAKFASNIKWGQLNPETNSIGWNGDPQCTWQDVESLYLLAKKEIEDAQYKYMRSPEYPQLTELADAIYWQAKGDNSKMTAYIAKVDAIKAKYPKP